jgi:hypothetical protein
MWIYLERDEILQIMQVLQNSGKTQIAGAIQERLRQENRDAMVDSRYRDAAKSIYQVDGELEFDPSAVVSKGEDAGAYVMGWQWVADEELAGVSDRQLQAVDN